MQFVALSLVNPRLNETLWAGGNGDDPPGMAGNGATSIRQIMQKMSLLIGYNEASDLTGVPVNTLKDYRAKGKGPRSAVIGGRVRYRRADVLAWIDEQFEQTVRGAGIKPAFSPLRNRSATA